MKRKDAQKTSFKPKKVLKVMTNEQIIYISVL